MKILVVFALCAVLYFELSHGLHLEAASGRVRRDAEKVVDLGEMCSAMCHYAVNEIVKVAKETIQNYRDFLVKIIEEATKTNVASSAVKKMQGAVDRINELLDKDVSDGRTVESLIDAYFAIPPLMDRLDELEKNKDDLEAIEKLFEENKVESLKAAFLESLTKLHSDFEKHIGEYIASLTAEERVEEKEVIDWFEEFKSATGTENIIKTTKKAFDVL